MTSEAAVRLACLLEVTARKPGNVHPGAAFADCDWRTFADSAEAIAPILGTAAMRPLGETIYQAVAATRAAVGRNTNLGIILLLAPLAAVPDGRCLMTNVGDVLHWTTPDDCDRVFEAIRLAAPGGLGAVEYGDVAQTPTVSLHEAMELAADRDDVARQYVYGFEEVFDLAAEFVPADLPGLERQIVREHLFRLAAKPDTLIARKCGPAVAAEAMRLARAAAEAGGIDTPHGRRKTKRLDAWLRADGHRRNPGTTADLIAAALFIALREGQLPAFEPAEVVAYAAALRSASAVP